MSVQASLDIADILPSLEKWLDVEFTFYRVEELAADIARRPRGEQNFLLDWIRRIATTNIEIAYQFARRAPALLGRMDWRMIEAWALHAMDSYDKSGLRAALLVIEGVDGFAAQRHARVAGALFEDIDGILFNFVRGLSGRRLNLAQGDVAYTDSETLFLPTVIAELETLEDNFRLAKATVTVLWAQTRFGTFHFDLQNALSAHPRREQALRVFTALETLRLEACIRRELPGLYRDMQYLKALLNEDRLSPTWQIYANTLADPHASVEDSLRLLPLAMEEPDPPRFCYQGEIRPEAVAQCMAARIQREKALLRVKLAQLAEEHGHPLPAKDAPTQIPVPHFQLKQEEDAASGAVEMELMLDGVPLPAPEDVKALLTSIQLDLGHIPDEYLTPAGPGEYDPSLYQEQTPDPNDVWQGAYHEIGATLYDEWDFGRQHYRKNWCVMREKDVTPVYDDFARETLARYSGVVKHLRRSFEAMRDENKLYKRQPYGDEVDIDALVEALADARDGREMSDRLFTRMHRAERNIAVMFMVDMSGSTRGWINDAERETLLLLCEALETLGDRYGIYGFSGQTRKRCELYRIKEIDEPYGELVKARISGIRPQDYTRMGFAIRHLTRLLSRVEARTKLLITLSDGKPDDYFDVYRGQYGIEDTRQALIEAKRAGIHSFCITIDQEARDYLPHMYGAAHYAIIDDVRKLPLKVADIYRRLTT
ncbi:nitric oxide reductase activation protein NorD [Thiobacter aerophilum]|uniref:VWA domain-containing protein n=1 Tax=Thiobacter aerophilum TaxID=3121275 RepID=A0ABV0EG20_9BURK